jgi:hypothetical protein
MVDLTVHRSAIENPSSRRWQPTPPATRLSEQTRPTRGDRMATQPAPAERIDDGHVRPRTGPVSRLTRLLLAALLGWLAYDVGTIADLDEFREPGLVLLTGFAVYGLYAAVAAVLGARWAVRAVQTLTVLAVGAATGAAVTSGSVWSAPLSWLMYGLDVAVLAFVAGALVASVFVGAPGCEIGSVQRLAVRLTGRTPPRDHEVHFCLAGLHRLDAWEARRPWQRGRQAERQR